MTHPCELDDEKLLSECESIRQRRSGPGGQHRNKVETAIRLKHLPSGVIAQASERRSQAENLKQAVWRLRLELALLVRTEVCEQAGCHEQPVVFPAPSALWQKRAAQGKLSVNPQHADFPRLLAELLDLLCLSGWDHKMVAENRGISASQLIRFLALDPRALKWLNEKRADRGLKPLH